MIYGASSYSQFPYSAISGREVTLNGISYGASFSESIGTILRCKKIFALGKRGNKSSIIMDPNTTGNIVSAIKSSVNRIDIKIAQKGVIRTGHIEDPAGIVYYELVKTEVKI